SAIAPQVSEPPVAESPGTAAPVESAQRSETSPGADTAPAQASVAEAPATDHGSRSAALELEDVTYLGGFPGQTKRRKRCIATLTMEGLEVTGPTDLAVRIAWTSVNSIETQNSDEARFRTNTKIHRDSSALVIDCEDGVTLMLEARDCPTVPLRSAITQLLGDLSVVVV
ncbi:MAG TPA: hypothetical protein VL068_00915, partial [Microthrixaceae bacterium]|nr:hypothetical protein [Microthrixaceae bacterium]